MDKSLLFLSFAGAMLIPASARALQSQSSYGAYIVNGFQEIPVSKVSFALDEDIRREYCQYTMGWTDNAESPARDSARVLESKAHGSASCIRNALTFFTTVVITSPEYVNYGFDRFQQVQKIILILGENGKTGQMSGLIQYMGGNVPSAMINAFELRMAV